jgi:site-specific recombinase XerD
MLSDLHSEAIQGFLEHLERARDIGGRSRNQRLAAIRSFFRYAALEAPDQSALIQRVLAIASKRHDKALIAFLTKSEIEALLAAPDRATRIGRRDHVLILVAVQTGLRVSELTGLCHRDVCWEAGAHIRCTGKGRKERSTPLTKQTRAALRAWIRETRGAPEDPLFPSRAGQHLSSDTIQYLLAKYAKVAAKKCPTLETKSISPHVLRHTTAIQLLQSGVDRSLIALWLGHESIETTQIYLDANLAMKEEILKKTAPLKTRPGRYRADDQLLAFLKGL